MVRNLHECYSQCKSPVIHQLFELMKAVILTLRVRYVPDNSATH